jgi:hypothetical protein
LTPEARSAIARKADLAAADRLDLAVKERILELSARWSSPIPARQITGVLVTNNPGVVRVTRGGIP